MTKRKLLYLVGGIALCATGFVGAPTPVQAAVVYCTSVGVPAGCVVRATPAAVYCTRPGYPVGCVGGVGVAPAARAVGAPGPGVSPVNRGGPVNRVGVR